MPSYSFKDASEYFIKENPDLEIKIKDEISTYSIGAMKVT